ncbi:MFS transporter [Streptomyces yokosukanensis]|uniref:MFS transporter n=1 Tax=Streptomyces yokosukanensis TaxID=67386 RepID=A0A117Q160_9ACTN|nr:MFS transporter [Streptomyces yokosukanensis]KUN03553.1 MFS transporter [Streptomyces yokosukanensis]
MRSSLLKRAGFRWFLTGQAISLLGSSMAPIALTFAVLAAEADAGDLGVVLAARMVPLLGLVLVGGVTADRYPRRTVLLAANLGSALTQGAVAAVLLTGRYALHTVASLEFLNGVLAAFTTPALRGVVPQLVDRDQLRQANAMLGSIRNATKILGPSLAGVIVVTTGSGTALALDALTYLLAALCLARLPLTGTLPKPRSVTVWTDIRDGWSEFRRIRWVWIGTASFCVINLVQTGTWQILGPTLTKQLSGETTWGFMLSARGIGLLAASTLLYRLTITHLLRLGQLASTLTALPLLALGTRADTPWLITAALISGLGMSITGIAWETSLHEHVPGHVLSRVASYNDLLSYLTIPMGQLSVAPLTHAMGGYRLAAIAGAVSATAAVTPLASTTVRRLRAHGHTQTNTPSQSARDLRIRKRSAGPP